MTEPASQIPAAQPLPDSLSAEDARRYRKILDSLSDMVFCKSTSYQVTFANRATQEYYDATEEQLHGVTDVPYNQLDFTEQYLRDDRIVLETGQRVVREEEPNVARDGTIRYFHTVKSPILDDAGRVVELVGVSRDVTEQHALRLEAERSRTHLELALDAAEMGTWEWDIENDRVYWSSQEERLYGLRTGTFTGTTAEYTSLIHPDDREKSWAKVEEAIRTRSRTHHILHRIVTPLGEVRWLDSHGRFIYAPDGRPTRLVGISVDVTARMVKQEELQRQSASMANSRDELLRLFDQTPASISVTNARTQVVTYQNARSRALIGGRVLTGKRVIDVFPDEQVKPFLEIQKRVSQTGQPYVGNEVYLHLDLDDDGVPEDRYFNFIYQPLREPSGDVDSVMSFAVEVTDQVRARQLVEAKAEELARLTRALEASNRDLDHFAYVASHDLKAPLRGIANLAQWIEEDVGAALPAESRQHFELLKGRVARMEALIDGILAYSRAARTRDTPEEVDTGALVREIVDLLALPSTVKVTAERLPTLVTERVPLQQALMNLIANAVKHSRRPDTEIQVTGRDLDGVVEFSVSDNGPGIAPGFQERIWGIFQTLESRDEVEGTGIGLAVVRKLVETRGGTAGVRSAPGKGATFYFTWPRTPTSSSELPWKDAR